MMRVAIVGGGISGLSAAYALEEHRRAGANVSCVLYESSSRLGGILRTEEIEGCIVEGGPDSFLTEKPWAADLCRELGIGDQLIGSNDADRKTYIFTRGRLVEMPDGLMFMVPTKIIPTALSPLFSWKTKLRMARELFYPSRSADQDESVAAFVERHYGREMVDRLVDPLLSGIYGGEADSLSLRAVLPRFAEMERTHGSLGRAMLTAHKKTGSQARTGKPSASSPGLASSIFTSLKNGMQQLADAIVSRLPPSALRAGVAVQSVQPDAERWSVSIGTQSDHFDAVIVALPAYAAAHLLRTASADLAVELGAIDYSSSITVGLGYDQSVRQSLPSGFGFLVPRSEGRRLLAATFVHNKFPSRVARDRALLRCFFAGANAENLFPLSDEEIVGVAHDELRQILGLRAEPLFSRVYRWKSAMAQYGVGHLERLERIERSRRQHPRLALAGNGYRGIGIPDCVRSGREAAEEIIRLAR